jgi:GGDEF domain-containing protein
MITPGHTPSFETPKVISHHFDFLTSDVATPQYKDLGRRATQVLYETLTDPLTGLKNEKAFHLALDGAIERVNERPDIVEGEDSNMILLRIDVDGFKEVNDRLGHHVGDEILQKIGHALRTGLRKTDKAQIGRVDNGDLLFTASKNSAPKRPEKAEKDILNTKPTIEVDEASDASRPHGDEFDILIVDILSRVDDPDLTMEERIAAISKHLRAAVTDAIGSSKYNGLLFELGVGISIGAAVYRYKEGKLDLLIRGDENMYIDKSARKSAARLEKMQSKFNGRKPYAHLFRPTV